jgi:hypothetical protein
MGVDQISEWVTASNLQEAVGLPTNQLNDAVSLLEVNGYAETVRTMGMAPYSFREVAATALGRVEHLRSQLPADAVPERGERAGVAIRRNPVPVGSPYGFEEEDWEYVEDERERIDVLKVVLGHQFESEPRSSPGTS